MQKLFLKSKKSVLIISLLGLYLISTGVSVLIFGFVLSGPQLGGFSGDIDESRSRINLDLPRTEECPINGEKFTKIEKDIWMTRRPITAMIENHADSRPPSGLSSADVVYEVIAEGGITRFLSVFYCGAAASEVKIAPVRSARVHFISYASEYGKFPIFMHVGGANDYSGFGDTVKEARALELLESIGWRTPKGNDFDTTYDSGFPVFWRNYERLDHQVATEHTMMASLDAAYAEAEKRGFTYEDSDGNKWDEEFSPWKFIDEKPSSSPTGTEISFGFWDNRPDYDVVWKYDSSSNSYKRSNGGSEHIDLETDSQITAKNVVILFARERGPVDRNLHILYTTVGTGEAIVFQNGAVTKATWEKETREDRTKFFNEDGREIEFVRGQIWIEVLPLGNQVSY